jgi:hypothetical protein
MPEVDHSKEELLVVEILRNELVGLRRIGYLVISVPRANRVLNSYSSFAFTQVAILHHLESA